MIVSVLNFICCPLCGIPALIFAILGQDAEKRREIEAAKSHAYHAKIFNIVGLIFYIIYVAYLVIPLVVIIVVFTSIISSVENSYRYSGN